MFYASELAGEEWRRFRDTEYYVSNMGRVKRRGKIQRGTNTGDGYHKSNISVDGRQKHMFTHRLVAETFLPNPYKKPCVNHKNSIRNDNRVSNLEWVSQKENMIHSFLSGNNNGNAKLDADDILMIRSYLRSGFTQTHIAKRFGVSPHTICDIALGKAWAHIK